MDGTEMNGLEEIKSKLKGALIEQLSLEDLRPEDIDDDEALFEEGLALDSLDAVEIVVVLQRQFGINMKDADMNREVFQSINTLAGYIQDHSDS